MPGEVPLLFLPLSAHAADADAHWRLDHIFPDVAAFATALGEADVAIEDLEGCRGKLGDGGAMLLSCLDRQYESAAMLGRLSAYASNHAAADTRDDAWRERESSVDLLYARLGEATSWTDPEIVALGTQGVEASLAAEPGLARYAYPLRSTLRRAAHVLSPEEERILALSASIIGGPEGTYVTLANADLPWPEFVLPDGSTTVLRQAEYGRLRGDADRELRERVYDEFFGTLGGFEDTMGSLLSTQVEAHWFAAQARGYGSCVEAALDRDFLPKEIVDTLVEETNASLPTLHRYLRLRARMLGVDDLGYHDLYVPLVSLDRTFTLDDSKALALASVAPLGRDYVAGMKAGYDGGWMDVYPAEGKRSGAYMDDAAYGVHPYLLLNHNDDYASASTFAHEWGHAMHSQLAMKEQPYATVGYATFLAEVASTFNEALLLEHALKIAKTDDERLFYLGSALENLRTTFFRQAMFGEFELAIHAQVERGEPLSGGSLTTSYAELVRRYHGPDTRIDDAWTVEWAFVPHFYYDFYVFQYATSLAASSLLADRVIRKERGAVDRYLGLLRAGGSDDPYVLLKVAGVDLATPEPYRAVAARMNAIMDRIEAILDKRK